MGIVGMWKDRREMRDPVAYLRSLRQDRRSKPLWERKASEAKVPRRKTGKLKENE